MKGRGQSWVLLYRSSLPCFLRGVFYLPGARQAAQQAPGIHFFRVLSAGIQAGDCMPEVFTWVLGMDLRCSCLCAWVTRTYGSSYLLGSNFS